MSWLVALFAGSGAALLTLLWRLIDRLTHGKERDEALTTKVSRETVEAASGILTQLRIESEVDKRRIAALESERDHLLEIIAAHTPGAASADALRAYQAEAANSAERIATLEAELSVLRTEAREAAEKAERGKS